jgi:aminoglycoside phosphotransferase family enzyme
MTGLDVTLDAKVAFLQRPGSYPTQPERVESIETHMAWVFLTASRAYKLKKPVLRSFLDFSTIEARRHNCEAEVRLNRRLAPDTYLETVPLTVRPDGRLELRGSGVPSDWLVKMRRLPRERFLDHAIEKQAWRPADIERLAALLVAFYRRTPTEAMTQDTYSQRLRTDVEENLRELLGCAALKRHHERVGRVATAQSEFLNARRSLLDGRVAAGRILEGHGDLRPEHVSLGDPPIIIDCLEFNRAFRILDPLDELAFFAIECERLGAPLAGEIVVASYRRLSGDQPPDALLAFYRSHRALLRAKIAMWHIGDDSVRDPLRWVHRAQQYIELSERALDPPL